MLGLAHRRAFPIRTPYTVCLSRYKDGQGKRREMREEAIKRSRASLERIKPDETEAD